MTQPELIALAKATAEKHGLDPAVVCAVCEQESGWDVKALRLEQGFYRKYVKPLNLPSPMESLARSASWGLMQVMGQVAREHGFDESLDKLCTPESALQIGCKVLAAKLQGRTLKDGLLRYNGGGNPNYPAEVIARIPKYQ